MDKSEELVMSDKEDSAKEVSKVTRSSRSGEGDKGRDKRNALVAIVGRPSAGKSTFLNTACQEAVSITSHVPQTTRNAIRGIVNTSLGQLVFVDTPGYHLSEKKLNLKLKSTVENILEGADLVLYIIDATRKAGKEEELIVRLLKESAFKALVVAINKTDKKESDAQGAVSFIKAQFEGFNNVSICLMSALKDEGINEVLRELYGYACSKEPLYTEEVYTDQSIEFRSAEIIRGEAIRVLDEEIPHCLYVKLEDVEWHGKKLWIRGFLYVERESQKGIVVGKGAKKIKAIRLASESKIADVFECKAELHLNVKVDKNWRQKDSVLKRLLS